MRRPTKYQVEAWDRCRVWLDDQIERRVERSGQKGFVKGPYFTVTFPDQFTDEALNYVYEKMGGVTLVSVTHRASEVYQWGTSATFNIGIWPHRHSNA